MRTRFHAIAAAVAACGLFAAAEAYAVEECHTETETRTVQKDHRGRDAVAGAVVGGLVGHAVGGTAATVIGAGGGAAVGNHVGKNDAHEKTETTQVRKCVDVPRSTTR